MYGRNGWCASSPIGKVRHCRSARRFSASARNRAACARFSTSWSASLRSKEAPTNLCRRCKVRLNWQRLDARLHHTAILIDVLDLDKIVQRLVTVETAETAPAVATRLGFGEQLVVVVDPDGAIPQRTCHPHRTHTVIRPYTG